MNFQLTLDHKAKKKIIFLGLICLGLFLAFCSTDTFAMETAGDDKMREALESIEKIATGGWARILAIAVIVISLVTCAVSSSLKPLLAGGVIVMLSKFLVKYATGAFGLVLLQSQIANVAPETPSFSATEIVRQQAQKDGLNTNKAPYMLRAKEKRGQKI